MKRSFAIVAAIALAASMLLGSCDQMFTNYFKEAGLGQLDSAAVAEMTSAELIAASGIESDTPSASFYEALEDEDTRAAVTASLEAVVAGPDTVAEEQAALALLADIQLETTGGGAIVDNLLPVLLSGAFADLGSEDLDFSDFVDALVPADVLAEDGGLAAAIDALAESYEYYITLAGTLDAGAPVYDAGVDAGTIAQAAVLGALLDALTPVGGVTIGEAFAAAYANPTNVDAYITMPDDDPETILDGATELTTLLSAAGINLDDYMPPADA